MFTVLVAGELKHKLMDLLLVNGLQQGGVGSQVEVRSQRPPAEATDGAQQRSCAQPISWERVTAEFGVGLRLPRATGRLLVHVPGRCAAASAPHTKERTCCCACWAMVGAGGRAGSGKKICVFCLFLSTV